MKTRNSGLFRTHGNPAYLPSAREGDYVYWM